MIGFCLNTPAASLLRFVSAQAPAATQTTPPAHKTVLMNVEQKAALFRKVRSFYPKKQRKEQEDETRQTN